MGKPEDPLRGLKSFSIGGRLVYQRERCVGMTNEERRWRAQFVKDQVLTEREPVEVPEYYKETTNIFRRLYKTPFNKLEKALQPVIGKDGAYIFRHALGKTIVGLGFLYLCTYYIKYHANDFIVCRSLEYKEARKRMWPHDPDYPNYPVKKPSDYYDMGFYSSVLCREVKREPPPPPPPAPPPPLPPSEDFQICRSLEYKEARKRMWPHDPDYPNYPVKKPSDYYDMGFYSSVLAKKVT